MKLAKDARDVMHMEVTPSRDDVILKKAAEMAESFVSCQSIFIL